jgi:membrane protein
MTFYHFLASFPSLLVVLAILSKMPSIAPQFKDAIAGAGKEFLPQQASLLLQQMLGELDRHMPAGLRFLSACAGTLWAALNGTWALVYGLNKAYEVDEHRSRWKLAATIVGLTFSLALLGLLALVLLFVAAQIEQSLSHHPSSLHATAALRTVQWMTAVVLLMFSFSIIYRFAPNLRDHDWKWSTPGAVCALLLWVASTVGVRFYFQHVNDYTRTYGHLNSVVMLLLWLYLTNGAILIGGEMNSEIEKAADQDGNTHRSGS